MRLLVLPFLLHTVLMCAQQPALAPVHWSTTVVDKGNGDVLLNATAILEEGWHVYALTLPRNDGPLPTVFSFAPSNAYELLGEVQEEKPVEVEDPNFAMLVRYHGHAPVFMQKVRRGSPTAFQVKGSVEYMACNDRMCLPPATVPLVFTIDAASK